MKQGFAGKLRTDYLDEPVDGKWFQTVLLFSYTSKDGSWYAIPAGMYTDFASTRPVNWLIPKTGKYGKAAVFHDWLCDYKIVSRKEADKLFLEAMETLGVSWLKRRIMYAGVRAWAVSTFKK